MIFDAAVHKPFFVAVGNVRVIVGIPPNRHRFWTLIALGNASTAALGEVDFR